MGRVMPGDEVFQDFTFSQKPVGLDKGEVEKVAKTLVNILSEIQKTSQIDTSSPDAFKSMLAVINAPKDAVIRQVVKDVSKAVEADFQKRGKELKYVIHCGIGGSELGATMLISATSRSPRVYFPITSLNNDHIGRILNAVSPEATLLIKATRSNTTKETLTAFELFREKLKLPPAQCVAIIDKTKKAEAKKDGCDHFIPVESTMSGRFTALHAANLFTMHIMGVDIEGLHEGARHMLSRCTKPEIDENPGLEVAVYSYLMNTQKSKSVFNAGVFSPDLIKYGDWLGQLIEESLVHRENIGITTKTSELSNKAHSYFQGWLAGANAVYHQFLFPLRQNEKEIGVKSETLREVEFAEYKGISQALANAGRPSYTTYLKSINPKALGQLMMRDMIAVILMGELYGLRKETIGGKVTDFGYFNQPGVEAYKEIMKAELKDLAGLKKKIADIEKTFVS